MKAPQLSIDPEDLGFEILPAIERSFGIKFTDEDFHEGFTYGELHALVLARLPQPPAPDCTTQQAFYKLRRALRPFAGGREIRPGSRLTELLPLADPRPAAAAVQAALGMKLELVGRPAWAAAIGVLLLLSIGPLCFAGWHVGALALSLGVLWLDVSHRLGRTVRDTTMREVVEHMASRYYRQSRRHPDTVNPREIKASLDALFLHDWGIKASQLVPEAVL